ncbi:MAG: putative methyltransferase [Sphingomonas bacterium]|uniref:hypothetical protein n=1 Tax=Sphingomonas bacterium TaxID=1895847 RepID=UPI00260AE81A|nr:hypothetical protein [Sphingomonas bacterium]MDB5703177.1 putative methyltransferase [Sphingomonas bacterium]
MASWTAPAFCRSSWASETARALWEPRFRAARTACEDLAVLQVADGARGTVAVIRPASLARVTALAAERGVALRSLDAAPATAHAVAAGRLGRLLVAIGDVDPPLADPIENRDDLDPVWRLAGAVSGDEVAVAGDWAVNPLLAPVGLVVQPLWPRGFDCPDAVARGAALVAAAARHDRAEAIGWLHEALSWPVAWSALHGIAEIKTPVFRFIRNAPPTPGKLSVRREGDTMPEGSARGLGFPFAAPRLSAPRAA